MSTPSKLLTAGSIVGIVIGCLLGALYIYCCILSARKAIRDRRAKIARNMARRKAKEFRDHHKQIARKIYDIRGHGKLSGIYPYYLNGESEKGRRMSMNSVEGMYQSYHPSIYVSSRRRSSSTIPPTEVIPKVTLLPNRKFAITKTTAASSVAVNNSARPPPGLMSGLYGTRFPITNFPQPPSDMTGPVFLGGPMILPLATKEPSLDDSSDLSSEISSFISGSFYGLYAGPSFRRRNSYENAMRRNNLPPVAHPLRDRRAQAAAEAAARTIDRLAEIEIARRKELEKERQIIEDLEGETRATQAEQDSEETLSGRHDMVGCMSSGTDVTSNKENGIHVPIIPPMMASAQNQHIQCPVWIHPDVSDANQRYPSYADYNNYL